MPMTPMGVLTHILEAVELKRDLRREKNQNWSTDQ